MPTEAKASQVQELKELFESSTVAISADFTGMGVGAMTELRRALREHGVRFRVVKNRLAYLAADAAQKPIIKEIVEGPTGIAFGFGDPVEPAKALTQFIRATRSTLEIKGAVLGDKRLSAAEVDALAALPPRDQLIARLIGQIQAPISGLVYVLNATPSALARVLQRAAEARGEAADTDDQAA